VNYTAQEIEADVLRMVNASASPMYLHHLYHGSETTKSLHSIRAAAKALAEQGKIQRWRDKAGCVCAKVGS
jgi:hypothetical protein